MVVNRGVLGLVTVGGREGCLRSAERLAKEKVDASECRIEALLLRGAFSMFVWSLVEGRGGEWRPFCAVVVGQDRYPYISSSTNINYGYDNDNVDVDVDVDVDDNANVNVNGMLMLS